jgi:SAM-dependent methyltransferase
MRDMQANRDRGHETYDYWRYQGRDWHWFEGMFRRIRPVAPVLDIGSGLGFFVECCVQHGVPAVGLELSKEGVEASRRRNVPVVRGDLSLPLPFQDDAFGTVFAHHVLEHMPIDKERALLREVRRVLRPGGFLYAASPSVHHPRARDDPDHVNLFTVRDLDAELQSAGFSRVSFRLTFWHPFWDPNLRLGRASILAAALLWRIAPSERHVGVISGLAWK